MGLSAAPVGVCSPTRKQIAGESNMVGGIVSVPSERNCCDLRQLHFGKSFCWDIGTQSIRLKSSPHFGSGSGVADAFSWKFFYRYKSSQCICEGKFKKIRTSRPIMKNWWVLILIWTFFFSPHPKKLFACALKAEGYLQKERWHHTFSLTKGENNLAFACFLWREQKDSIKFMIQKKWGVELPAAV